MAQNRQERINEEVRRELSDIIRGLKDHRVMGKIASVVSVEVTKDLKYAKAFISVMGTPDEKKAYIDGLKSAAGFVRREVSQRLNLRCTPQFTFVIDNSVEYGIHINEIIHKINEKEDNK